MSKTRPSFPLFNRIAVLVLCSVILLAAVYNVVIPGARRDMDVIKALLLMTFSGFACYGIWVALTWRRCEQEGQDQLDGLQRPEVSEDAVEYHYFTGLHSGSVIVDPHREMIHFLKCHVPRRFLARVEPLFSCPFSDLKAVYQFNDRGVECLTVVSESGKAVIPNTGANYGDVSGLLTDLVGENQSGFATDDPRMGVVWLAGAMVGLFTGFLVAPQNSSDSTLGVYVVCGAILGVICSQLLIRVLDRTFKVNLARIIGYGTIGVIAALNVGSIFMPLVGWSMPVMAAIVLVGFLLGAFISHSKQSARK